VKSRRERRRLALLVDEPQQAREARAAYAAWVERSVWTDLMLAKLATENDERKWSCLIDKVYSERSLKAASAKVLRNRGASGVDGMGVKELEGKLDAEIAWLAKQLHGGTYQPQDAKRVWIPKAGGGRRPLGVPTVKDRTVQTAMRNVMEPIFEKEFHEHSYGFRPGRGCKDALRRVDGLLKDGFTWIVDADLKSFFDTIPHEHIMRLVGERIADGSLLELLRKFLKQGVMEGMRRWTPETGTPQGAVISPLLANVALNPLDHEMAGQGYEMTRYADDFVIQCRTRGEAEKALELVKAWTADAGLQLHGEKTSVSDANADGFEFLGYRFHKGRKWPRRKSRDKFRDGIRALTRRSNGHSLEELVERLNPKLRGWFNYFKHCYKSTFRDEDGWVRGRLRSILGKRTGRKGHGRGCGYRRWPNSFFAAHGLFSLTEAHAQACRPLTG
jgi:RNA-directed DNA polymerase